MGQRKPALAGHMKKAIDRLEQLSGTVNLALEVVDARAPEATRCPIGTKVLAGCETIIVFTKADLADATTTRAWTRRFEKDGQRTVIFPFRKKGGRSGFIRSILQNSPASIQTKAVVVGLPNVGKSTVLNMLTGKKRVRVGAQPGVTRGLQMVNVNEKFLVLDTPGIVTSKVIERENGLLIALTGCLQENVYDSEEAACLLMEICYPRYKELFLDFYDVKESPTDHIEFFDALARRRGFLRKGGVLDVERVFSLIQQDFSTGRVSGVTLEEPPCS